MRALNFKAKRVRHIEQRRKIIKEAKKAALNRSAKAKATAEARIERKRAKMVSDAKKASEWLEETISILESDHIAMGRFRADRIPHIKKRIAENKARLSILVRQAQKAFEAGGAEKAKKIWAKEDHIGERLRALRLELKFFTNLK